MTRGTGIQFNPVSMTVRCASDTRWRDLEAWLSERGATLGWVPPIRPLETIGELLEQAEEGLRVPLYGDIRANCVAMEAILPDGSRAKTLDVPRSAAGPDWKHLLFGGRGDAGRVTGVTLRAYASPLAVEGFSCRFEMPGQAVEAVAEFLHRGALPAVGFLLPDATGLRLEVLFEGRQALTAARVAIARRICANHGAGGLAGQPSPSIPSPARDAYALPGPIADLVGDSVLRLNATWRRFPELLNALERLEASSWVVTGFRHLSAAIWIGTRDLNADGVRELTGTLVDLGGVLPFEAREGSDLRDRMAHLVAPATDSVLPTPDESGSGGHLEAPDLAPTSSNIDQGLAPRNAEFSSNRAPSRGGSRRA